METISLLVNGCVHQVLAEPDTALLYVLRNELGLTGAKFGCGLEQCGACQVLVEGEAVYSCVTPVAAFQNRAITTIEGLADQNSNALHPLQATFISQRAAQCGYCIPGIIIAAKALLDRYPQASETEIRQALDGHLCRCGSHGRILDAIKQVVAQAGE